MTSYVQQVWRLRFFWFSLVQNDLRSRYRRSMIGIGWSLLQPLAMTIVLCLVFAGLWQSEIRVFGPYLITGLVTWTYFASAVKEGANCFFQSESYIRQLPAPLAIFPLRTVLGAGFHFLLGLVVAIGLAIWCQGTPNILALLSLIPCMAILLLVCWSLAVCFGIMNVIFQDTQHLADVLLQILFYLTPILYKPEMLRHRHLGWLVDINPFSWLIELIRQPIITGQLPSAHVAGIAVLIALVAVALAALVLARYERRVIFYL